VAVALLMVGVACKVHMLAAEADWMHVVVLAASPRLPVKVGLLEDIAELGAVPLEAAPPSLGGRRVLIRVPAVES